MRIFDLRILLSIWVSLAGLLALQVGLNALKYRSLVIEAAAARMQIPAGTIEAAIAQSRNLGIPLDEIAGLSALITQARDNTAGVTAVRLLDAQGDTILNVADEDLDTRTQARLRQRLIVRGDAQGWIEIDDTLFVGRLLSGGGIAGDLLILMSLDRSVYATEVASIRRGLIEGGLAVFLVTSLALTPFVLVAFRPARVILSTLDQIDLDRLDDPEPTGDPLRDEIARNIVAGNRAEAHVAQELDRLAQEPA